MINPVTLASFLSQWDLQYTVEVPQWRVGAEIYVWNRRENLCCAPLSSDISLPQVPAPERSITSKKFFGESTSCLQQERRRERERERRKKGGGRLFLCHVALICLPAANENDDLQKDFFTPFFFCICPGNPHSWSHAVIRCNFYSIMNTTTNNDRTCKPGSHVGLTDKTAGFPPTHELMWMSWSVMECEGSANYMELMWQLDC